MIRSACMLLCLLSTLVLAGCGGEKPEGGQKKGLPAVAVKGVVVETIKTSAVPETAEVVGTVRAHTTALVSARIAGTISVLRVREGDRVRKGQLLAQLVAQENVDTAAMASSGSDEAQHGLDEALARRRLADTTFERYQKLFQEQAVTRQEFDTRQAEKELAAQTVARAEARLKQARNGARAASAIAGYTRIVAPIAGVISSRQADLGTTVFPAQPLMTIEDDGSYQLELAVPESLAPRIRPGTPVQVVLDAVNTSFNARIAEIVPSADPVSRSFIAKITLTRKGLRSGMFGRGAINLGTSVNGIFLSKQAVMERGALTSVWVVTKDNIARMRLVKAGKAVNGRVEILSGLSDGERVVTIGAEKVSEGGRIE
jgi:multidrug efflux system membrane fusion protein